MNPTVPCLNFVINTKHPEASGQFSKESSKNPPIPRPIAAPTQQILKNPARTSSPPPKIPPPPPQNPPHPQSIRTHPPAQIKQKKIDPMFFMKDLATLADVEKEKQLDDLLLLLLRLSTVSPLPPATDRPVAASILQSPDEWSTITSIKPQLTGHQLINAANAQLTAAMDRIRQTATNQRPIPHGFKSAIGFFFQFSILFLLNSWLINSN